MIKRRFYKLEHGDRDAPSESSSSSSDFDLESEETEDSEEEGSDEAEAQNEAEENVNDARGKNESSSSSSGYDSEDSSASELNLDSSGSPMSDDDTGIQGDGQTIPVNHKSIERVADSVNDGPTLPEEADFPSNVIVKCKNVFKCKLCPRIVCLSEVTLWAHLKSKRHARSVKLLKEGRLKHMLNDDGRITDDTLPDKQAPENFQKFKNKKRGPHRQIKRPKKKKEAI